MFKRAAVVKAPLNRATVRAFLIEMSILPGKALSVRRKPTRRADGSEQVILSQWDIDNWNSLDDFDAFAQFVAHR